MWHVCFMNNSSFLILGREAGLAFAEIYQFLGNGNIEQANRQAIIVRDGNQGRQAAGILGGVPKSGVVLRAEDKLSPELLAGILRPCIIAGKKFHFGLSVYGLTPNMAGGVSRSDFKRIGLTVKKILKQAGHSVRLVESKSANLSSVDVVKNKLLAGGVELCIFTVPGGYLIGKTEAVQPFAEYSRRDYGRPARDAYSGMLPPKLAKIMINIAAGARRDLFLLDPFCGSGTILQEALLAGHNVLGADIDKQAVASSRKNLEWLTGEHRNLSTWRVEWADARRLEKAIKPRSVDIIASEFYLGPPLSGRESREQIAVIEKELSALYRQALPSLAVALKDNGRAVFAWPYFKTQDVFIAVFDELVRLGWEALEPYPQEYQKTFPLSRRGTLLYGRPDQRLWREILILRKR